MDKGTRNAIENATQRARKLLEEDFSAQLEGDFDVHRSGAVAAKAGSHLSARQAFQRERIVAAIEHKRAAGMDAPDAVTDYLRDAAFTTLNRFVALKMLEARELVQECITKGEQSSGYREFCGLAPGLPLLPNSAGYRLYIESLFDELSTEIKVLFDRRDPASVLWPKRLTFAHLLEILNAGELAGAWGEDETIGWVYQFFNSKEERAAMRDPKQGGSQAPRNSRELAVRNQFFTPRYVVQFLTDNTLGRIWYEMRGTKTALAERCEYMVRKPDEKFASRPKKDPRDIRLLDPACGSGHFLLYAFDLLLTIYEEAYTDDESPKSDATGKTLAGDYPSLDTLRKAVPALILAHNLHGVDIDARCAQIGQLALWMRAQRTYRDLGVGRAERPQIRRSNIVVAEPLVADDRLVAEFIARLGDAELGRVFTALVDTLKLAGDLGLLLRVETLAGQPKRGQSGDLLAPPEVRIRAALQRFVSQETSRTSTRHRLFAEDTSQGLGLLEAAERTYDVILMNPPFGEFTARTAEHELDRLGTRKAHDLYAAFVLRAIELAPDGAIGAITSRAGFFMGSFETWRRKLRENGSLSVFADLGYGVLDALVEVCVYVYRPHGAGTSVFLNLLSNNDKDVALGEQVGCILRAADHANVYVCDQRDFDILPAGEYAYWLPREVLRAFSRSSIKRSGLGLVRQGLQTGDDFRFLRAAWEVDRASFASRWRWLAKGGEYSPYYDDVHLVVDWTGDGSALWAFEKPRTGLPRGNIWMLGSTISDYFFRGGWTYTKRTTSGLTLKALPRGVAFSDQAMSLFPVASDAKNARADVAAAVLISRAGQLFVEAQIGLGDAVVSGSAARRYTQAIVESVPVPPLSEQERGKLANLVTELAHLGWALSRSDETTRWFRGPPVIPGNADGFAGAVEVFLRQREDLLLKALEVHHRIDAIMSETWGPGLATASDNWIYPHPLIYSWREVTEEEIGWLARPIGELIEHAKEVAGGGRFLTKKTYVIDRKLELVSHMLQTHPAAIVAARRDTRITLPEVAAYCASDFASFLLGAAFGRWSDKAASSPSDPWEEPRVLAPIEVSTAREHLCEDEGHALDLSALMVREAELRWGDKGLTFVSEVEAVLGCCLRDWVREDCFRLHFSRYSKSRRNAPIYWRLSTPSSSYAVWLFYHSLTADSLFRLEQGLVGPKIALEELRLEAMRAEIGASPNAAERRLLETQERLLEELRVFIAEIRRVAPLWGPKRDDGVVINFAPLWRLVPHDRQWQKELRSTWGALCAGEYDWAHLAMHLWPERVIPKCAMDRSLAITHGIEDVFWVEGSGGKWTARKSPTRPIDELVRERTSPAVKAALKTLLEAPVAAGSGGRGGRRRAAASAK